MHTQQRTTVSLHSSFIKPLSDPLTPEKGGSSQNKKVSSQYKGDQSLLHFKGSQTTSGMTGKVKVHTEHTMIFINLEQ